MKLSRRGFLVGAAASMVAVVVPKTPSGFLATPTAISTPATSYDPELISLIRKNMPEIIAREIIGVQPLRGPTASVFKLRSKYPPKPLTRWQRLKRFFRRL